MLTLVGDVRPIALLLALMQISIGFKTA